MDKLTDVFCLAIFFVKFNILVSFILHFLANIERYTPTFSSGSRAVSCIINYGGKVFIADGGQIALGKFIGGLFCMEG